ncbi:MAG: hypothetical protein WBQ95_09065 [Terracidiphilus sp.]
MFNECRHIKPNGIKCKSPALRSTPYCYFHTGLYRSRNPSSTNDKEPIILPSLEDCTGVQIALQQVLGALGSSRIDPRCAGLYLRGLQIAARLANMPASNSSEEFVRDLNYENNGDSLAPEKIACEPPQDCLGCDQREQCEIFEDYEDEVEQLEESAAEAEEEPEDK